MCLSREKDCLLLWDESQWIYLLNGAGQRQAQLRLPQPVTAACCADDGSAVAAGTEDGQVWWLAPDLTTRWERAVPARVVATAIDSFGQYLVVSDSSGGVHIFDRVGRNVTQLQSARPFHYLAFVPAEACFVASSDFGLVGCLEIGGRWRWRDGLVLHAGSLAVSGDGTLILLACFTEGLQRYDLTGKNLGRLSVVEACRLAALSYDGRLILAAGLSSRLLLLDEGGRRLCSHPLDQPPVAVALAPLGDRAAAALPDGRIIGLELPAIART